MRRTLLLLIFVATALSVKLSYDPRRGYSYTITGGTAEEVVDADVKIKGYLRKGKIPPLPSSDQKITRP